MKQFWFNPGDAQDFSDVMNKMLANNEYTNIASVRIQNDTLAAGYPGSDPINGAQRPYVTYDMRTLPRVNADALIYGIKVVT